MIFHVTYKPESGLITQTGCCSGPTAEEVQSWPVAPDAILIVDQYIERIQDWRVVDGVLVERTTMAPTVSATTITADGTDACVITGLPTPCVVAVSGVFTAPPTAVTDGMVTLTATAPGTLTIRVTADPAYKAWETTIHAV